MKKFKNLFLVFMVICLFGYFTASEFQGSKDDTKNLVNINTAKVTKLKTLPRIGEKTAQRIIQFREKNGKFKRIQDLMKVKGIGEKIFNQLKDKITV